MKETRGPAGRIAVVRWLLAVSLLAAPSLAIAAAPDADPEPGPAPAADAGHHRRGDAGRGDGGSEAAAGHLRLRHARHGLPDQAERPQLVRRGAADQASRLPEPVRRRRALLRGRPAEPPRRQGLHPHRGGRDQDDLRVRAVRHRRGRGPDDIPPAPRLGRAGPGRGGPDLEPVHGPRRLPELDRILGPYGHGVLPERPAPLDALAEGRLALRDRSRAAGGERGPGRLRGPHRAPGREGPVPPAGSLRAVPSRRAAGVTCSSRASCAR